MTALNIGVDLSEVGNPNPGARVQVRDRNNLLHPGCCAMCGNGSYAEGYVDPQVFFDYEGQVYFCTRCVEQMANAIGCLDRTQSKALMQINEHIAEENKRLKNELTELAPVRSLLRDAVASGALSVSDPDSPKDETGPDEPISDLVIPGAGDSTKPVESSKSGRPNDAARPTSSNGSSLLS